MMREVENDILRCYCFYIVSVYIKGSVIEILYRYIVYLLWLKQVGFIRSVYLFDIYFFQGLGL